MSAQSGYAGNLWFRTVMHIKSREAINNGQVRELDDGILVVVGRAQTGLQNLYGTNSLPVFMGDTFVAELIMTSAHWKDLSGQDITMVMLHMEASTVNTRKLAKKIANKCVHCRCHRKTLEGQMLAMFPVLMQVSCRPFTNMIYVDQY